MPVNALSTHDRPTSTYKRHVGMHGGVALELVALF